MTKSYSFFVSHESELVYDPRRSHDKFWRNPMNPAFQERINREVPLGRLVSPREDAQFAAFLCSEAADVSQVGYFPFAVAGSPGSAFPGA
jgi:hypothetical protein